jgi:2-polyprenyl-3-methyl-5-hydroxy-6-metoxy-1,4-benzoquinol methylase
MERVLEPELMDDGVHAGAYARADFAEPNGAFCRYVEQRLPDLPDACRAVDLGCGPGDIALRLARAHPGWRVDGVDGAAAMLDYADRAVGESGMTDRVRFVCARLPGTGLEPRAYDLVISNSLLHHLEDPLVLWHAVRELGRPGGAVMVMDLSRPSSESEAHALVETHSSHEPAVLKEDFFRSLLAAHRPEEVRAQLLAAGLDALEVQQVSDRHVLVWGWLPPA